MIRSNWVRWLQEPPVSGLPVLLWVAVAVGVPTIVRAEVNGVVTGCEYTPYLPFVLLGAILLRWWQASAIPLLAVGIMGGFLGGAAAHEMSCFAPASGMFLVSSGVMIGVAILVRRAVRIFQAHMSAAPSGGIVFSLENDEVWASWYGDGAPVRLGSQRKVSEMMEDFLAQSELGKQLISKYPATWKDPESRSG
ncbi:MAG: hypothetical protein ACJ8EY_06075 [Sphingomicrobium sp.]